MKIHVGYNSLNTSGYFKDIKSWPIGKVLTATYSSPSSFSRVKVFCIDFGVEHLIARSRFFYISYHIFLLFVLNSMQCWVFVVFIIFKSILCQKKKILNLYWTSVGFYCNESKQYLKLFLNELYLKLYYLSNNSNFRFKTTRKIRGHH